MLVIIVELYDEVVMIATIEMELGRRNILVTTCSNAWVFLQVGQTTFLGELTTIICACF